MKVRAAQVEGVVLHVDDGWMEVAGGIHYYPPGEFLTGHQPQGHCAGAPVRARDLNPVSVRLQDARERAADLCGGQQSVGFIFQ